jgi:hypothetical protein
MTREEALAKARAFALQRCWTWSEPVHVQSFHPWWVGALRWRVRSNADAIGMNVWVEIDDRSGDVIKANFITR